MILSCPIHHGGDRAAYSKNVKIKDTVAERTTRIRIPDA